MCKPLLHALVATVCLNGAAAQAASAPVAAQDTRVHRPFNMMAFKTEAQVRAILGPPVMVYVDKDRVCWYYKVAERQDSGEITNPEFQFIDGEVRFVLHYPPEFQDDHIKTARLHRGRYMPPPPPRTRTYSLDAFMKLVQGQTRDAIWKRLGQPEIMHYLQGKEVWQYQNIVVDAGRKLSFAIQFEGDRAVDIQGG